MAAEAITISLFAYCVLFYTHAVQLEMRCLQALSPMPCRDGYTALR